jgi:hypothetical protein
MYVIKVISFLQVIAVSHTFHEKGPMLLPGTPSIASRGFGTPHGQNGTFSFMLGIISLAFLCYRIFSLSNFWTAGIFDNISLRLFSIG